MSRGALPWLALLGIGVLMRAKPPKPPTNQGPALERNLDKLVPSFRTRVDQLLGLMRAAGYDPLVWETYRPPERAAKLAAEGTGVLHSQHELGLAVDIVDRGLRWNAPPAFWDALHKYALELGLGRIKRRQPNGALAWDQPHVQALPGRYDTKLRALNAAARETYLRTMYTA